jgi:hypothetical protein
MTDQSDVQAIRDAIFAAARATGLDGKGEGEFTGFFRRLELQEPGVFGNLLGRLLLAEKAQAPQSPVGGSRSDPDDDLAELVGRLSRQASNLRAHREAYIAAWIEKLIDVNLETATIDDVLQISGDRLVAFMMAREIQRQDSLKPALTYVDWISRNPSIPAGIGLGVPEPGRPDHRWTDPPPNIDYLAPMERVALAMTVVEMGTGLLRRRVETSASCGGLG